MIDLPRLWEGLGEGLGEGLRSNNFYFVGGSVQRCFDNEDGT